jgi:hypothetical protein
MSPLVPVLGPAVEAEDDVIASAGFGVMKLDAASPDPVMGNPVDMRRLAHQPERLDESSI